MEEGQEKDELEYPTKRDDIAAIFSDQGRLRPI